MAHEIDTTTGKAAVFTGNGKRPWHTLGITIQGQATSGEAIKLSALDWQVLQANAMGNIGGQMVDSGQRINYRSDTLAVLGTVGPQYTPCQNADCFAFMDSIVGQGAAAYDTAGSLFGGRKVWMLAKLPKTIKTTRKDVTEGYIAITNAHDGSESWRLFVTLTRIVCNNTKTIALNNAGNDGITYRHTGGLPDRLEEAKAYLGIIDESMEKFETATKVMAKAKLKGGQLGDYAQALFPHDDAACAQLMNRMMDEQSERATIMRELLNGYERQTQRTRDENKAIFEMVMANHENERQGVAGRGTTWAAYNAVSEWVDHQRSSKSADQHFETVLTGKGDGIKTDAFDLAYAYAQNNTSAV